MTRPAPTHATHRHAAFSLPELLVVIFIIAALMSVGLFAAATMRESAQVQQTRGILQALANAATEFQAQTGRSVPAPDGGVETIEWFIAQARQVPEVEQVLWSINADYLTTEIAGGDEVPETVHDVWETRIEYRHPDDPHADFPERHRPYFASAGPDETFGTDDDIYSFDLD
ncbi:MAG: type II secretion system protein [Phycisphaeraceae bacterium]